MIAALGGHLSHPRDTRRARRLLWLTTPFDTSTIKTETYRYKKGVQLMSSGMISIGLNQLLVASAIVLYSGNELLACESLGNHCKSNH